MEPRAKITSSRDSEFSSRFEFDNETYDMVTEDLGTKKCLIITRIYLKGEILSTVTSDYTHLAKLQGLDGKLRSVMERQHESTKTTFMRELSRPEKSKAKYAQEMRAYQTGGDNRAALRTAREALESFPADPFFLSHCGCLTAIVENKSNEGARLCEEAINILRKSKSTDIAFFLPLFYLHLGRACLRGNRKRAAMEAFQEGLKFDAESGELLSAIRMLGIRKRPAIPFLDRGNALNKCVGKFRHKFQNRQVT